MVWWGLRRVVYAVGVVLATMLIVSLVARALMPGLDPSRGVLDGVAHDLDRMLLHLDFGQSTSMVGRPAVADVFDRSWGPDLSLLIGGVVTGAAGGALFGALAAAHPRSMLARGLDAAATIALCTPVYVLGFCVLLLFEPSFGAFKSPLFFEPGRYDTLAADPWAWLQSMLVPWLLVGAPIGGVVLRLMVSGTQEALQEPYVRTAVAKGLTWRTVVRRHAARPTWPTLAAFLGTQARQTVLNIALVEYVFFVPGFFQNMKKALGSGGGVGSADVPLLQGMAVWSAVLVMLVATVAEVAVARLDPRVGRAD